MWESVLKNAILEPQYNCDSIQFDKHIMSMGYMQNSKLVLKGNIIIFSRNSPSSEKGRHKNN